MFAYIEGKITHKSPTFILLENGGIGYLINISLVTFQHIQNLEQCRLYTYMNIKKDGSLPNNMSTFFIQFLEDKGFEESKLEYEFGKIEKLSPENNKQQETQTIPQVAATLDTKNIKIAQRESMMWGTVQQEAISFGNVVHEILSFIARSRHR